MPVKTDNIKKNPLLDAVLGSKNTNTQTEDTPVKKSTAGNPLLDVVNSQKKNLGGTESTTEPKTTSPTPSIAPSGEDINSPTDPLQGWHRRKGDDTQLKESQKQGGLLNLKPDQNFNYKLNNGDLTVNDIETLKKKNPEKFNELAKTEFPTSGDAFIKSNTAAQMLSDNLNKKAKQNNFIEAKNYDAKYYNNLDKTIDEVAAPANAILSTGVNYTNIKPTKDVDESRNQLKILTEAEKNNQQQINKDKVVNFVAPMVTPEGVTHTRQFFDITKMSNEEIESKKTQSPELYNQLIAAKQKVAQGLQKSAVFQKAITPIQAQFGSNLLTQQKAIRLPDPNKDGNDYVREIGEEIFKQKDPETYALYKEAGGYDKTKTYREQIFNSKLDQVNKEIMTLGYNSLRGDIASNGTDQQYANVYDNLKYLDYKFSTPKEQETKHRIAAALKENNIDPTSATPEQKDEIAKTLPLENQEVWFNKTKESGHTDLPNTGFLYSSGNSFVKTGTNILKSGSVASPTSWATLFLGVPTNKETAQEILGERMSSDVLGENPESIQRYNELSQKQKDNTINPQELTELNDLSSFTDKRTSWDKFKDGNGNMVGMIAGLTVDALPTLGGGIMSKGITEAQELSRSAEFVREIGKPTVIMSKGITDIPLLENTAANTTKTLAQRLNLPTDANSIINLAKNKNEMFVLMHHDNAKRAMELFPDDDTKKAWYTGITDVIAVALPNILPTHKLGELFNAETKTVVEGLVSKMNEKNLDKAVIDNMMTDAAKKIISKAGTFVVGAEKTAAEAALTMSLMTLGNNVTQAILKPDSISGNDISNNFTQIFSSTFMDSQLVGLVGGYGAVQKKYGQVGVDAIYDATNNINSINSVKYTILDQKSKGELTTEEANNKISILNTAAELRKPVDDLQVLENLTPQESKRVFINLLNERIQKNKVKQLKDSGASEALIKPVEKRIKEINDINDKIINKGIFVNDDYSIIDVKEKEKQEADAKAESEKQTTSELPKEASDAIQKAIDSKKISDVEAGVLNTDEAKITFLKQVAQQAKGEFEDGTKVKEGGEQSQQARNTYGDEVVDAALKMFPQEKKSGENVPEKAKKGFAAFKAKKEAITPDEKDEWSALPMSEKLRLARQNLPEVDNLSQSEVVKVADENAKKLLQKLHGNVEPETVAETPKETVTEPIPSSDVSSEVPTDVVDYDKLDDNGKEQHIKENTGLKDRGSFEKIRNEYKTLIDNGISKEDFLRKYNPNYFEQVKGNVEKINEEYDATLKRLGISDNLKSENKPIQSESKANEVQQPIVKPKKKQSDQLAYKRAEAKKVFARVRKLDAATDARGMALEYFANGGQVSDDSMNDVAGRVKRARLNIGKENRTEEAKSRDYVSPDADSFSQIAHKIWDDLPEELQQGVTDKNIENELMAVAKDHTSRLDVANTYLKSHEVADGELFAPEEIKDLEADKDLKKVMDDISSINLTKEEEDAVKKLFKNNPNIKDVNELADLLDNPFPSKADESLLNKLINYAKDNNIPERNANGEIKGGIEGSGNEKLPEQEKGNQEEPPFQVEDNSDADVQEMKAVVKDLIDEGVTKLDDIQRLAKQELGDVYDANLIEDAYHAAGKELKIADTENGKPKANELTTSFAKRINAFVSRIFGKSNDYTTVLKDSKAVMDKANEISDAKFQTLTPEQQSVKEQLDAARSDYQSAKRAFDNKRKELDKTISGDQEDLFGNRPAAEKKTEQQQLFDERVSTSARDKAMEPFKVRLDKSEEALNKLQKKFDEMGTDTSQISMFQYEYSELPKEVQKIVDKHGDDNDKTEFHKQLAEAGYTTNYDAESFGTESGVTFEKINDKDGVKNEGSNIQMFHNSKGEVLGFVGYEKISNEELIKKLIDKKIIEKICP